MDEANSLVDWLQRAVSGQPVERKLEFMEPELAFCLLDVGSDCLTLEALLSHAFYPSANREDRFGTFQVSFKLQKTELGEFVASFKEELRLLKAKRKN